MHLSLNWLAEHVDLEGLAPAEVARELTMRTALVEGLHDQRAALAGVVVGEVLERAPHPGADRLSLCTVAWGGNEPARVVCGAPNVAAGQKVLYAPVGVRLPNGLKLKKAKIRGEPSEGMICAEDELGLGPEHDGILVLPGGLEPGRPAGELPGLADVVLEIENKSITHRPDLWGHRGFARELAAIFGRELRPLELDGALLPGEAGPALELAAGEGCPLYAGLCVEDVPSRSPDSLRFRLLACGMRPIGLLVDLSNYVMLELGQPTHPFDRDRLEGDRIVVRRGAAGEVLRTLDDVDRALGPEDVIIADGRKGVAIGGIMGSAAAEVGPETRRVFLESASFDPRDVRRTSSRLGLRTEALARFEKGLDPALVEQALRRYAALLRRLRPQAVIAPTFKVAGAAQAPRRAIPLAGGMVRRRLGMEVADDEIEAILGRLGFGLEDRAPGRWEVQVPSWRSTRDVTLPEDLVEEVGRVAGYDRVQDELLRGPLLLASRDPLLKLEDGLRDALARQAAFTESSSYSTVRDRTLEAVGLPREGRPRLANALQQDAACLRPSLAPGMLTRVEEWLRQADPVRCFEVGRGYHLEAGGTIRESREVAVLVASSAPRDARDVVRELRGLGELGVAAVSRGSAVIEAWTPDQGQPWLHPGRAARLLVGERCVARLGAVSPSLLARLGLSGSVGLLVFDVEALAACEERVLPCAPVPRFPPARIDLAFVAGYDLPVARMVEAIRRAAPASLRSVEAFDVYRGPSLGQEVRSVAFHLVFQSPERTLTDEEVGAARVRIVKALEAEGARLR